MFCRGPKYRRCRSCSGSGRGATPPAQASRQAGLYSRSPAAKAISRRQKTNRSNYRPELSMIIGQVYRRRPHVFLPGKMGNADTYHANRQSRLVSRGAPRSPPSGAAPGAPHALAHSRRDRRLVPPRPRPGGAIAGQCCREYGVLSRLLPDYHSDRWLLVPPSPFSAVDLLDCTIWFQFLQFD